MRNAEYQKPLTGCLKLFIVDIHNIKMEAYHENNIEYTK